MINFKSISFVVGLTLSKLALFMWLPMLVAFFSGTAGTAEFLASAVLTHVLALIFTKTGYQHAFRLSVRDMFVMTTLTWLIACAFATLPFLFLTKLSFTNAYFEAMSGLTTTGSTVMQGLDHMPPAILLWRSLLQWLGGIGFIVLAVAVLPYLNVGGMRLFQMESSDRSEKDSPKMSNVARNILIVYVILSIMCCVGYWFSGMSLFDAINHAMTTLSTGGFSTKDASMSAFSSRAQWVAIIFMFLGGLPFILYVQSVRRRDGLIFRDAQVRGFFWLVIMASLFMSVWLWHTNVFNFDDALRISAFNIISILTTTGYGLTDFGTWSFTTTVMFFFLMLFGACSGSTAGGLKLFRIQIAAALFQKQARQLMHPAGVFPQKYNGRPVNDAIVRSIVAFVLGYLAVIVISAILLGLINLSPIEAISGAITAVGNVGPGFGDTIGPLGNFSSVPDAGKWVLAGDMLMGRLEILTVAVLLFPSFWKD
jgi:trk system potassium uptake protein